MPQRVVGANEVKGNDDATSERRLRGILRKVHVRITRERGGREGEREKEMGQREKGWASKVRRMASVSLSERGLIAKK
jgi:hypothetical protein